jgi:hypothetical protein
VSPLHIDSFNSVQRLHKIPILLSDIEPCHHTAWAIWLTIILKPLNYPSRMTGKSVLLKKQIFIENSNKAAYQS